jgi:hypothetical protein
MSYKSQNIRASELEEWVLANSEDAAFELGNYRYELERLRGLIMTREQLLECSLAAANAIYDRLYNPHDMDTPDWAIAAVKKAFERFSM